MMGRHLEVALALLLAACTFTGLGNYTLLCVPGALGCSGQQPQICNGAGTGWDNQGTACSGSKPACAAGSCVACTVGSALCPDLVCTPGSLGCDGEQPQACNESGTAWQTTGAPCSGVYPACLAGACVLCGPGTTECTDAGHVKTCDAHGKAWGAPASCASHTCVKTGDAGLRGACEGICGPTQTRCADALHAQTCDATGQWSAPSLCSSQACVNDGCTCVCAPGALGCNGQQPQTCSSLGQWANTGAACSTATTCIGGLCTGECGPTQTKCADDLHVVTCGPTGGWTAPAACPSQACVGNSCTGVCAPGTTQCSGNGVQTCSSVGQWSAAVACGASAPACCAGACTSEQTDPRNCGACATVCSSGHCYRGFCDGVIVPSAAVEPDSSLIAVDATSVYWVDSPASGNSDGILKASLASGTVSTLATAQLNVGALAIDANNAYWLVRNAANTSTSVVQAPLTGGTPITLGAAAPSRGTLAVGAADVYWGPGTGGVLTMPIGGGSMTTFATLGSSICGGEVTGASIAVNSTDLFCAGAGGLVRLPFGAGSTTTLATAAVVPLLDPLALDATNVYTQGKGSVLLQVPIGGGSALTLATTSQTVLSAVGVTAASVYWQDLTLNKVPIGGGVVTTLVPVTGGSGVSLAWTVDATSLYVGGLNGAHGIVMMPN